MDRILKLDYNLFLYLNNLGNTSFDQFWILVSGRYTWIPLYVILLYFLVRSYSKKSIFYSLIFIILGIMISDQISNIFKFGIERLRPCHDPILEGKMRSVLCGGSYGFYSAHASNSFFIAFFMIRMLREKVKNIYFPLILWASIVSYSRIYLGVHFPLDILFGAMVGLLLGGLFSNLTFKTIYKIPR